jgi:DNA-directed RNA polymerase specialized sigma24 family protein
MIGSRVQSPASLNLDAAMARLADGDASAFDSVFEALWPTLRQYCIKSLGNAADGEDAAQRALLKMLENAPAYDRSRPALGWGLSFAFWECRSERARQRRQPQRPEVEQASLVTPEELALHKEQQSLLASVLGELSESERALVLKDLTPELAGSSPAATRKRRQRVLERLREALRLLLSPKGARP